MRLSQSGSLTAILFLLTPQTLAQKTPLEFTRGTRLNDPFCLSDGQDGETRILTPGDLSGSCDALAADQTANCYWASNVWAAQHQLDQVFQGSSSNTCGHCTTNFTCFEVSSNGREIFGAGPETYNDVQVTADEIFLGLQNMLSTCNPNSGKCGIQYINDYCVVQTYFADQLIGTNCPDSPCPDGDFTCALWGDSTCGDDCCTGDVC